MTKDFGDNMTQLVVEKDRHINGFSDKFFNYERKRVNSKHLTLLFLTQNRLMMFQRY